MDRPPLSADSSHAFSAMALLGRPEHDGVIKVEIVRLLGPNGAGKTTTMEMIEGLHQPDSGEIRVLGMNVRQAASSIKHRVGVQLQTAALYPQLTVEELLALFGQFFDKRQPVERLLVDLEL